MAFTNPQLEQALKQDGYAIVDFMQSDELEVIEQAITRLGYGANEKAAPGEKFRVSVNHETAARKNEIYETFFPFFQCAIDKYLRQYKVVRIGIYDKRPGGQATNVHQHVTLLDESKHVPLGAWISVVDTTVQMGTLHVVKGSHNVFDNHIRAYWDYDVFQKKLRHRTLRRFSTPLLLRAGQGIVFHERLIHWSPPNKSSRNRTAFQLKLFPREHNEDVTIYYRVNDEELEKYRVDLKSYRETDLAHVMADDMTFVERIRQPKYMYDSREFKAMMKGINND